MGKFAHNTSFFTAAIPAERTRERSARAVPAATSPYALFWLFVIASVIGLLVETIVSYPIDGVWKDRAGLVWGPFSPIYGVGAVLMTLAVGRLKDASPLRVFLSCAVVGAGFEFIAGWFFKHAFGIVAWDYSSQPFNLCGHTCLGIAICWGVLGLLWAKAFLPFALKLIARIPESVRTLATTGLALFLAVDVAATLVAFDCWYERLGGEAPDTPVEQYFEANFGNDFMAERFQTMSLYPEIASLQEGC